MLGEKHNLANELPEYKDRIHDLKMSNKHFANQYDKYHEIDEQVLRIEEGIENTSDEYLEELKKRRLAFKDELFAMIRNVN
jgi:uncharacterized protein YdcH (DUF465 family)